MKDGHNAPHRVRIAAVEHGEGRITLRGEFDLGDRQALREVLRAAYRRGRSMLLDLSGMTFMDVGCARELVFWCLLGLELLVPVKPSWQAALSFAACGFTEQAGLGTDVLWPCGEGETTR